MLKFPDQKEIEVSNKVSLSKFYKTYYRDFNCFKPYYYDEDDVNLFKDTIDTVTKGDIGYLDIAKDLHTLIPPVNLPIVEHPTRPTDMYGLFTMNLSQFLIRPTIYGVQSCHSCSDQDYDNWFCGNLGYIYHPGWSCIGVYSEPDEKATWGKDMVDPWVDVDDFKLPPLKASFNVCAGFISTFEPCVFISKIYGDPAIGKMAVLRYARYMRFKYGVNCFIDENTDASLIDKKDSSSKLFFTLPAPTQIKCNNVLVERYDDILSPREVKVDKEMYYFELLKCARISSTKLFHLFESRQLCVLKEGVKFDNGYIQHNNPASDVLLATYLGLCNDE